MEEDGQESRGSEGSGGYAEGKGGDKKTCSGSLCRRQDEEPRKGWSKRFRKGSESSRVDTEGEGAPNRNDTWWEG